jgi:hypothetical protein
MAEDADLRETRCCDERRRDYLAATSQTASLCPECTNLTLGIPCGGPCIGVVIHARRVTSRRGCVAARPARPAAVAERRGRVARARREPALTPY